MRAPNDEQKIAIEVSGGVLSAGAGSGKTFVLIEHTLDKLLRLAADLYQSNPINWLEQFFIKSSRLALLTFTKKAAAEMKSRLSLRLLEIECPQYLKIDILRESIDGIFVGTIHSFLLKLIKDGALEGFENVEITSSKKFQREIYKYVDICILSIGSELEDDVYNSILSNIDQIKSSFTSIFNDAEMRISWEKFQLENVEKDFWLIFYSLNEIEDLINLNISLQNFEKDSKKIWFQAIQSFINLQKDFKEQSFKEHLQLLISFFENYNRITPPRKEEYLPILKILNKFKILRAAIKSCRDDLELSVEKNKEMTEFYLVLKKLFHRIDSFVKMKKTITFSTLEYFFAKSDLAKPPLDYLLVDEFQDTSWAQHGIIEKIVSGGWENIFVVGDKKQAIYRFRGGEVDVFDKTIEKSNNSLQLANNYRSHRNIVEFNNSFFSKIFPLGIGFQEIKNFPVEMEAQKSLSESNFASKINLVSAQVDQRNNKLLSTDIDKIESGVIVQKIEDLIKADEQDIVVLYPKLKPSYFLIKELIKSDFNFISQSKLNILDQPIISVIKTIVENALGFFEDEKTAEMQIYQVFQILGIHHHYKISRNRIKKNTAYFGLEFALLKEVNLLACTISDKENTIRFIKDLCSDAENSLEKIWLLLKESEKESFSIELRNTSGAKAKIQIMSVHSSKGLEFDNVILGGIHTNGSAVRTDGILKKWPGSFKWRPENDSKKLVQSPNFILENLEDKILDFNEQKRLLYVACTRARNSLYFPYLNDFETGDAVSVSKNSWINAIILMLDKIEITRCPEHVSKGIHKRRLPFFHIDNFGIKNRDLIQNDFHITADQSVTGLSELFFCSKKYYLSNICKIDESSLEFINEIYQELVPEPYKKFIPHIELEKPKSSKKRGSQLHRYIEEFIKGNILENIKSTDKEALEYCFNLIKVVSPNFDLFSEYSIKFKFNGQFINGICDLVLLNRERSNAEIWDFKTGGDGDINHEKYEAQLKLYAIGILNLFPRVLSVSLKIVYLDEKKTYDFNFSRFEMAAFSKNISDRIATPWNKNEKNCQQCEYQKICQVKLINC